MKKLMWIEEKHIDAVKTIDEEAIPAELVPIDSNAVIITYVGRGSTPEEFVKISRRYKLMLENSIASLEQNTKKKFELIFAQDDNHMRKADDNYMNRLGWHRIRIPK